VYKIFDSDKDNTVQHRNDTDITAETQSHHHVSLMLYCYTFIVMAVQLITLI